MLRLSRWLWAVSSSCVLACAQTIAPGAVATEPNVVRAPGPPPPSAAGPNGIAYRVRTDAELKRMSVELCLKGAAPQRLVYGSQPSVEFLREPRLVSEAGQALASPRVLNVVEGQIDLTGVNADACLEYAIDLRAAVTNGRSLVAYPCLHGLVTSTELFLWRPPRRAAGFTAQVRFELPAGLQVSVPWREQAGVYTLDETAFSFTGHALFGRFWREEIAVPSATISVVSPEGYSDAQRKLITAWITNAGNVVSLATGRFPIERAQVIVLPTGGFRFGHTGRSGGASVLFFIPDDVGPENLRNDWIAIHEFSHLLHPFVQREDAWLSEGLATYLQEVLRVRAGMMSAEDAWRRLYEGAALGRDADGSLGSETQRMPYAGNYRTVYWAGAAIALMVDVELRMRSGGRESLDSALAVVSKRPELMSKPATAESLLAGLDESVGGRTCRDVAQRYLAGRTLPDLADLYRQLGLLDAAAPTPTPGPVQLKRHANAPLAWIRDAIMAAHEARAQSSPFGG
ncbi:MAG TPA: hypothetical protein VFG30_24845 [Polyangiales bacterium]|nr:hypothetical protein [Polyangiales bacterium]